MTAPGAQASTTAIHRMVDAARAGAHPRIVARMASGWAVMGEAQFLPGYCLLLPDPVVSNVNDLDDAGRTQFLLDMVRLGDAVTSVCRPRRVNYEMLGNLEPALHAHVIPRYEREPAELRTKAIWLYPQEYWSDPSHTFDPARHADLLSNLRAALDTP